MSTMSTPEPREMLEPNTFERPHPTLSEPWGTPDFDPTCSDCRDGKHGRNASTTARRGEHVRRYESGEAFRAERRQSVPVPALEAMRAALEEVAAARHFAEFHLERRMSSCEDRLCRQAWAALAAAPTRPPTLTEQGIAEQERRHRLREASIELGTEPSDDLLAEPVSAPVAPESVEE